MTTHNREDKNMNEYELIQSAIKKLQHREHRVRMAYEKHEQMMKTALPHEIKWTEEQLDKALNQIEILYKLSNAEYEAYELHTARQSMQLKRRK